MNFFSRSHSTLLLFYSITFTISSPLIAHTWTSADGKRAFKGQFKSYNATTNKVSILREDGKLVTFDIGKLSEPDQTRVKEEAIRARGEGIKPGDRRIIKVAENAEMAFRWCPAGESVMGSLDSEKWRQPNETRHKVILTKGFWIAETECTQDQWEIVMGKENNPSKFKEHGKNHPVNSISWNDVQLFINKVNEVSHLPDGVQLDLPTEAQWEYACRAGTKTTFYHGNTLSNRQSNFNWDVAAYQPIDKVPRRFALERTTPVKSFPPNAWGIHDMHGNVSEYCKDGFREYTKATVTDPVGDMTKGCRRTSRGGVWGAGAIHARTASRGWYRPNRRGNSYCGFRLIIKPRAND